MENRAVPGGDMEGRLGSGSRVTLPRSAVRCGRMALRGEGYDWAVFGNMATGMYFAVSAGDPTMSTFDGFL